MSGKSDGKSGALGQPEKQSRIHEKSGKALVMNVRAGRGGTVKKLQPRRKGKRGNKSQNGKDVHKKVSRRKRTGEVENLWLNRWRHSMEDRSCTLKKEKPNHLGSKIVGADRKRGIPRGTWSHERQRVWGTLGERREDEVAH